MARHRSRHLAQVRG